MKVAEADREFLIALADELPDGDTRSAFQEIAFAAEQGEIPGDLGERVGELVALSLESGRARSVHGPAGVRALVALWRETPQGRRLAAELEEVNRALSALRDLPVQAVRVAPTGPAAYAVTIAAGPYEMRLSVDRDEVRVRSLNVGGGGIGE